jgi:hypothetical protein
VEAEELKGEKEPAHYAATGILQMEIVCPHPLGIRIPNFGDACCRMMSALSYN